MEFNFSIEERCSQYHKKVVDFFRKEFSLFKFIQEYPININNKTLYMDILIKSPLKVAIEINPDHHYKFVKYFHGTQEHFFEMQENDKIKETWAEMNNYIFIILKEEDFKKDEQFKIKLRRILG